MTAHAERDPLPPEDREPTAHRWAIEAALKATADAVARAKEARKRPVGDPVSTEEEHPA